MIKFLPSFFPIDLRSPEILINTCVWVLTHSLTAAKMRGSRLVPAALVLVALVIVALNIDDASAAGRRRNPPPRALKNHKKVGVMIATRFTTMGAPSVILFVHHDMMIYH